MMSDLEVASAAPSFGARAPQYTRSRPVLPQVREPVVFVSVPLCMSAACTWYCSTSLLSCSSWQWPSVTRNPIPLPTVTKLSTLIIYRMYCYRMSVMYTLSFKILYIPRCSYKNNYIKVWVCRKRCTTVSNYSTTCCMNCCCCLITEPDLLWACSLAEDAPSHMQHQVQSDYTIFLNKLK